MVNKFEEGQLYILAPNADMSVYDLDWRLQPSNTVNGPFVLLLRPRSENVPKGLPSRPWGNLGKILTADGKMFWARLWRKECCVMSKKWLKNNPFTSST